MVLPPAEVYAAGLRGEADVVVRERSGGTRRLPVGDWLADSRPGDAQLLDRCRAATLDVGCGPGRLTVALAARGLPVLGVDLAPGAAELARRRGAFVLVRSVFDRLPGTGRWATVLLADGNVGIGGDAVALLRRLADLLAPDGRLLVEVGAAGTRSGPVSLRLEDGRSVSAWFPWDRLSDDRLDPAAAGAGLRVVDRWTEQGRWFAALAREPGSPVLRAANAALG